MSAIYEADLYAWTKEQADALRRHASNEIDWENLAEEIESVGNSDRRAIESRLKILLIHLLKWRYQPEHRSDSWQSSIEEARYRIARIIKDSPSLQAYPGEALADAYRMAIINKAIRRLELLHLPQTCPWAVEQVLDPEFLP